MEKIKIDPLSNVSILINLYFRETGTKLSTATAFIYYRNETNYLITNWHNVTGMNPVTGEYLSKHCGIPDQMGICLQLKNEDNSLQWGEYVFRLYDEDGNPDWFVHPEYKKNVDVVAIELDFPEEFTAKIFPINNVNFYDFDLKIADEIFILGYPYNINGGGLFPVWKKGSVATEPDINIENLPLMYVDTASKSGMSGSPVIYRRGGIHGFDDGVLRNDTLIGQIQGFVGIYSGRKNGPNEMDAQLGLVWKKEVIDEIIDSKVKEDRNIA